MAIIGTIRKHSGIAVAVVGIAIVAFIIGDVFKRQSNIPDLAKIDGETVMNTTFENKVKQTEDRYKRQSGKEQLTNDESFQLREQVWNEMLEDKILGKQYEKLGIKVTKAELTDMYVGEFIHPYLRQTFTDPQTGMYNTQAVAQTIRNVEQMKEEDKLQWLDLEEYVKRSRIVEKYNNMLSRSFYFPKAMAQQVADFANNDVDARVVSVGVQTIKDEEVQVSDADLKNYYKEHKNMFKQDDARDLDFIQFPVIPTQHDMDEIADSVGKVWTEFQTIEDDYIGRYVNQVSDGDWYDSAYVKASSFAGKYAGLDSLVEHTSAGGFIQPTLINQTWVMAKVLKTDMRPDSLRASIIYILNKNAGGNITRSENEAKTLADSVESLVKKGMPFEEAVAQFSDDPQKSENQGDINWVADGAMFGTMNQKMLDNPVGTVFSIERPDKYGYMIVKITGKTNANKKYRVALITRKIEASKGTYEAAYEKANKFLSVCTSHQQFLNIAKNENYMVQNADFTASSAKSLQGVSEARDIVRWAFNEDRKEGDVSETVYESDNNYIVVSLKTIRKKGIATFEQVRQYIEQQVRNDKKIAMLAEKAEKLMASTKDINSLATQLNGTVDSVNGINFNGYSFGMYGPQMEAIGRTTASKKAGLLKPIKGTYGIFVVNVDNVRPRAEKADPAVVASQMEMESTQKLRSLFQVLKERVEIVDNRIVFY